MHLGGAAEFSTFRRTLAAILRSVLDLDGEDDPRLSAWINARLSVIALAVPDADHLGDIETAVLSILDPPLNLRGRPPTPIRMRLAELRRDRSDLEH
jgi:GIY-YIG catalytic domain-containing protein